MIDSELTFNKHGFMSRFQQSPFFMLCVQACGDNLHHDYIIIT